MGPKYCSNDGTNPAAWVCDVDWEKCVEHGYTDEGAGCGQCYKSFVLPVIERETIDKGKASWLLTSDNEFTTADCDLLTGWYMDAQSVCRCSENWYDNYFGVSNQYT